MAVPSDIADLNLWLMPEDLSPGAVATWDDRSAANNDATQGTAGNRPTKTTDGGGLPVVRFDGTNDYLTLAGNPVTETASSTYTLLWVVNVTTSGDQWVIARDDNSAGRDFAIGYTGTSAPILQVNGSGVLGGSAQAGGWQYFLLEVDNTESPDFHKTWQGGTVEQTLAQDMGSFGSGVTTPTCIGRRSYSGFEGYATMDLRCMAAWSRQLNSTEIGQMNTYAATLLSGGGAPTGPGMHVQLAGS